MEALALRLGHDPSYDRDEASWETRSEFYRLLSHYQSRELFDLFYASVQRELNARKRGENRGRRRPLNRDQRGLVALIHKRGAAPIQRALLAGDAKTGISIMRMEAGLDTGPTLAMQSIDIGARETATPLLRGLGRAAG